MSSPADVNAAIPGGRSKSYAWQVVAMLWWVCFFNYADRQAIFSVFPLLSSEFRLNTVQLGLLASSFAWVYAVAGPFAGTLVDRVRYKTALLAGLEVWSLICASTALARRAGTLLLFRGAEGLGESVYFPASMSLLASYHPGRTRSKAFGIHQTGIYAGTIAGGMLAGWIGQRFGWRATFVVFGALGATLGLVLIRLLKEPDRPAQVKERLSSSMVLSFARQLARTPSALCLVLGFGAVNFVAVIQLVWMPTYLYQTFHLSLAQASFYATAFAQCGAALGSLIGGSLADRRAGEHGGRITVQIVAILLGTPFVYLSGRTTTLNATLLTLALWGFCKGLYDANTFASLFDELPPSMRGVSTGFMNSSGWLLGGTTAPIVMGYIALKHGLSSAIEWGALGYVTAALLLYAAQRLSRSGLHTADLEM